jgi:hypothetical protein
MSVPLARRVIVPEVAVHRIIVLSLVITVADRVVVNFQSVGRATGLLWGEADRHRFLVLPPNRDGWLETQPGEALAINLSAAVRVAGVVNVGVPPRSNCLA